MAARLIAVSEVRNGQLGESSGLSRKFDPNDPCTYSTVRKYKCSLHGDQSAGPPVQKCEKTEQLLRKCPGRPVEVVESRTEYIEGDTSNGSTDLWDKEDPPFFLPQQPSDSHWPQGDSIVPRPKIEPRWPSGFGNRGESSNTPDLPGRPGSGHPGGVFGAFEDLVKETEDMAHSFLQILGLDGDEKNQSGNPFDRWFGGDLFGGNETRPSSRSDANKTDRPGQSTASKPDLFDDPKDFREV